MSEEIFTRERVWASIQAENETNIIFLSQKISERIKQYVLYNSTDYILKRMEIEIRKGLWDLYREMQSEQINSMKKLVSVISKAEREAKEIMEIKLSEV